MSTKLIGALMILLVLWGGYKIFVYYKDVEQQRWQEKEAASGKNIDPAKLPGVPYELEASLQQAQTRGADAMKQWLATFGHRIQDPRKAWIQLDYCSQLARENPQEAKAVYAAVKQRLGENSPVYPRLKQMQKSFE
jgi:hypothetical protein